MAEGNMKKDFKPYHEQFAEQVISMLEEGTAPWQKPWKGGELDIPRNDASGTAYNGINRVVLSWLSLMKYDGESRYMTLPQANEKGYRVKKGEHGQTVLYWQFHEERDKHDENGKPILGSDGKPERETVPLERPRVKYWRVFNVSQLQHGEDGSPYPAREDNSPRFSWNPEEKAEEILRKSGAHIEHRKGGSAYYRPSQDLIVLPEKEQFPDPAGYYGTALHELGHWTGHESRLHRDFHGGFGSPAYAREELRAEIASWMLSQDLGIAHDPGQHASYVDSWIQALKKDPYEIVRAARDAERIKEFVMGLDREQKREITEEKTQSEEMEIAYGMKAAKDTSRDDELSDEYLDKRMYELGRNIGSRTDEEKAEYHKLLKIFQDRRNERNPAVNEHVREMNRQNMPEMEESTRDTEKTPRPDIAKVVTWLSVPYREKNAAKKVGAQWDPGWARWYAPAGTDLTPLKKWLPVKQIVSEPKMNPREEFAAAILEAGLDLGGKLPEMDGKLHRVALAGRPQGKDGAYLGYLDGRPSGYIQNFVTGEKRNWTASGHRLSEEQLAALRAEAAERQRKRDAERRAEQDRVAKMCADIFENREKAASSHLYLQMKGVFPHGIKQSPDGKKLIIPLRNTEGEIRTVQVINEDGSKFFEKGGQKSGCFHLIGGDKVTPNGEILLAEGYATGASLYECTKRPVAVCFDAGNLAAVGKALREKYPQAQLTFCADDDALSERNIGADKAILAAEAVNGRVVLPGFTTAEIQRGLTDFNDLHRVRGEKAVREQVTLQRKTERSQER